MKQIARNAIQSLKDLEIYGMRFYCQGKGSEDDRFWEGMKAIEYQILDIRSRFNLYDA